MTKMMNMKNFMKDLKNIVNCCFIGEIHQLNIKKENFIFNKI